MKRRVTKDVGRICARFRRQQHPCHGHLCRLCGAKDCRLAEIPSPVQVRLGLQEQTHYADVPATGGCDKRRPTANVELIQVRLGRSEQSGDGDVAAPGCSANRRFIAGAASHATIYGIHVRLGRNQHHHDDPLRARLDRADASRRLVPEAGGVNRWHAARTDRVHARLGRKQHLQCIGKPVLGGDSDEGVP